MHEFNLPTDATTREPGAGAHWLRQGMEDVYFLLNQGMPCVPGELKPRTRRDGSQGHAVPIGELLARFAAQGQAVAS